ncbi:MULTISPECIES: hypothetical protein [Thiomicrorhabdus]|uniref:Hemerythrin-like domain-containing protein n=1 Tax=Thiomicrorhabdus heinhorstiae TaxID=2748010 RepID=A0ABS0C0B9_9GAMM|nr:MULTISPECIES: hypothetical protein [Thiomicrorhabdus]MBF6057691.1 hypothetical protein [Thiomicrorhabdus heinhorstiae]
MSNENPNNRPYKFGRGTDEQHRQDQALFSTLLEHHQQLKRETEKLPNGIRSCTTSENPELARIIQEHVIGMEKRFAGGRAIRSWDPLFAALFEYKDQIDMQYNMIDGGVEAVLTSDDPKLIELIHCHDDTLHGFVERGFAAGGEESPKPGWLE